MTEFTGAPVIAVEIDGEAYTGSYVIDGDLLIVYADGHGQDTARRGLYGRCPDGQIGPFGRSSNEAEKSRGTEHLRLKLTADLML